MLWTANTLLQTNHRPSRRGSNVCTGPCEASTIRLPSTIWNCSCSASKASLAPPTHSTMARPCPLQAMHRSHLTSTPSFTVCRAQRSSQLTHKGCWHSRRLLSRRAHFFSMLMHVCLAQSAMPCCSSTSLTKGVKKFCTSVSTWNVNPGHPVNFNLRLLSCYKVQSGEIPVDGM